MVLWHCLEVSLWTASLQRSLSLNPPHRCVLLNIDHRHANQTCSMGSHGTSKPLAVKTAANSWIVEHDLKQITICVFERNSTISPNFHTTHLINGIGQGITATMSSSVLLCQLLPLAQHGNIRPSRTRITGRSLQQTVHHTTGFRIGILKGFK